MVVADAKIQVLQSVDAEPISKRTLTELLETSGDGMNVYVESQFKDVKEELHSELSPVDSSEISIVPKTLLQ